MTKKNGFVGLLIVILVAVGIVAAVFLYKSYQKNMAMKNEESMVQETQPMEEFAPIEETASTPKEIANDALDELDSMMKKIDGTSNEDLRGLDL